MNFKIEPDEFVLISEDFMETAFLDQLFSGSVQFVKRSSFVRNGFHETNERVTRVVMTKIEEE